MVKITRPSNAGPPKKTARVSNAASGSVAPNARGHVQSADAVSFLGVPENEMTPRVRAAIGVLMDEAAALRRQLAEAQARLKEMSTLAHTDPLLGVLNRRAFVAELNRTLARVDRHNEAASLVYFDLDGMKSINDQYGHAAGDLALAHASKTILANIRQTDVFGRLGGDEFGVIFPYSDDDRARTKAAELIALIKATAVSVGDALITVSVTAGVASIEKGVTAEAALAVADAAMYQGKNAATNGGANGGGGG